MPFPELEEMNKDGKTCANKKILFAVHRLTTPTRLHIETESFDEEFAFPPNVECLTLCIEDESVNIHLRTGLTNLEDN